MTLTGMRSRWSGRGHLPGAGAVVLLVLLASCSRGSDTVAPPTSTTRPRATTTTTATLDPIADEIIDRYKQYWKARFEANQAPPNPDAPGLKEYATGQQLDQVVAETRSNLEANLAVRRAENSVARSSVKMVKVEVDSAVLQECAVDDDVVYRYKTGEVVNTAVATHNVEATMRKVDGVWKLASARLVQRWEGVAGCAVSGDF